MLPKGVSQDTNATSRPTGDSLRGRGCCGVDGGDVIKGGNEVTRTRERYKGKRSIQGGEEVEV